MAAAERLSRSPDRGGAKPKGRVVNGNGLAALPTTRRPVITAHLPALPVSADDASGLAVAYSARVAWFGRA